MKKYISLIHGDTNWQLNEMNNLIIISIDYDLIGIWLLITMGIDLYKRKEKKLRYFADRESFHNNKDIMNIDIHVLSLSCLHTFICF